MKKILVAVSAVALSGFATGAHAVVNLTAETASPTSAPGVSVVAFAEAAAKQLSATHFLNFGKFKPEFLIK